MENVKNNKSGFTRYIKRYWFIYLLVLPGFVHKFIFSYIPMHGILIAFQDYEFSKGIFGSRFVGLANFKVLFQDADFYKVVWNTVLINSYNIFFGTAFVVLFALLLNEIHINWIKRVFQTAVYLPNFLSWVVFAGLVTVILSPSEGVVNKVIVELGGEPIYFLIKPQYFRSILVISGIIKTAGFGTIIYLASIAGINPELYECAILDGANRFHMARYITLPRIKPTIAVLLILNIAVLFGSNFEQVYNLYSPIVYGTGDVISTFLYRRGLLEGKFEMATALGLIFSVFSLFAMSVTNKFVEKMDVMGIY